MRRLKHFAFNAIKESFDMLPTAVCFFDCSGGIVLCNRQMYRLSRYLLDSDMQYLGEVEQALLDPPDDILQVSPEGNIYCFPDKTVWRFEKTVVTDRYGKAYIQLTAADVTDLHWALVQLSADNRKLAEDAEKMKRLSENAEAVAREKEALAAKSAMHDSLAACLTITKRYLAGDAEGVDAGTVLHEWGKSIAFRDAVPLSARDSLYDAAKSSGVAIRMRGDEPKGDAAELMYTAVQVCLNNAIQYAQATELSVTIWEGGSSYTVMIRNNGKPPEKTITEGGGLTNLRRRIEKSGGKMTVQSLPEFSLVIDIPRSENSGGGLWL